MSCLKNISAQMLAVLCSSLGISTHGFADTISQNHACPGFWVMAEYVQKPVIFTEGDGVYRGVFTASTSTDTSLADISTDAAGYFDFEFKAPFGQTMAVGKYENCRRYPFQSSLECGIDVAGHGRGCNTLSGSFEVLEITRDQNGKLATFAADYTQDCENRGVPLRGSIRYKSSIPITLTCSGTGTDNPGDTSPGEGDDGDSGDGDNDGSCESLVIDDTTLVLCEGEVLDDDDKVVGNEIIEGSKGAVVAKGVKYSVKVVTDGALFSAIGGKSRKASVIFKNEDGVVQPIIIKSGLHKGMYYSQQGLLYLLRLKGKKIDSIEVGSVE